ncbi:hypothetical protein ACUTQ5_19020 [Serratia sp. NA_112.1]|uniref:hypothetical protein n=1 Tax=unclassified Serratia (in: enterobacteria) TaxID=2647522 RepID=UPI0040468E87
MRPASVNAYDRELRGQLAQVAQSVGIPLAVGDHVRNLAIFPVGRINRQLCFVKVTKSTFVK